MDMKLIAKIIKGLGKLKKVDINKLKVKLDYVFYADDKISESHAYIVRERLREDSQKSLQELKEGLNLI